LTVSLAAAPNPIILCDAAVILPSGLLRTSIATAKHMTPILVGIVVIPVV
jgi:hypothetical protein